jgi:uncharacterized protein (TIGR03435 family)
MPFWYHIPVPALPEPDATVIRLAKWLVKEGDEFHAGTQLAILETASGRFTVLANGDGFVRERLFPAGAELPAETPIVTANADGEKIPYGRPYSIAKRIESAGGSKIRTTWLLAAMALVVTNPISNLAAELPSFEVASVRTHKPEPGPFRVSNAVEIGRINFNNVTLKGCIRQAYGLRQYQVVGGQAWLNDDRYDIAAKASGAASKDQLMLMLQTLLAERFHLAVHRETKEMPTYSLVVAKKGPKIHPMKDDGSGVEIGADPAHPYAVRNISMAMFAGVLSRSQQVDRPVLDHTGLEGVFTFTLDLAADDSPSADGVVGPSIFTALQEQLGLKLEPDRGPVETLVIDHAERPTQN